MEYRKCGTTYVVRLDVEDEIVESLQRLCEDEKIDLAQVSGIGALKQAEIGVFDTTTKQYHSNTYTGVYEIGNLTGNISTMNGVPYFHLHITIGNINHHECYSGHLNKGVVGATADLFVNVIDGKIDREFSPEVGLNIIRFVDEN